MKCSIYLFLCRVPDRTLCLFSADAIEVPLALLHFGTQFTDV